MAPSQRKRKPRRPAPETQAEAKTEVKKRPPHELAARGLAQMIPADAQEFEPAFEAVIAKIKPLVARLHNERFFRNQVLKPLRSALSPDPKAENHVLTAERLISTLASEDCKALDMIVSLRDQQRAAAERARAAQEELRKQEEAGLAELQQMASQQQQRVQQNHPQPNTITHNPTNETSGQ